MQFLFLIGPFLKKYFPLLPVAAMFVNELGPSIDASYQASVLWQSGFRREDCLEINQSETRIAYGGHVC
jgi:hypothetical protein